MGRHKRQRLLRRSSAGALLGLRRGESPAVLSCRWLCADASRTPGPQKSSCCSEFEFCVACCQRGPAATGGDWRTAARSPGHPESGVWTSAFDYCRGMCRTTPRSTVHENAYIAPRQHHCFGRAAFPDATAPPPLPALPSGVTAVHGDEGASCTVACGAAAGSQCAREGFAALNTCLYLQASFPCEGGCRAATGAHLPGYNSGAVPDASTLCVRSEAETATCDAAAQHVRRLCPCKASGLLG